MPTRITKRTTLVQSPKVNPQVRQAIADLSRNQQPSQVNASTSQNIVLAANDPNVSEMKLSANTTYYLGHQDKAAGLFTPTREEANTYILSNSVRLVGDKETIISRSPTTTGQNGFLWIAPNPYRTSSRQEIVLENITFNCPVLIQDAENVTIKNCIFAQDFEAALYMLKIVTSGEIKIERNEFRMTPLASPMTAIVLDSTTGFVFVDGCYSSAIAPIGEGVFLYYCTKPVIFTGCCFQNLTDPDAFIGYRFTTQDKEFVNCTNDSNAGVIIT